VKDDQQRRTFRQLGRDVDQFARDLLVTGCAEAVWMRRRGVIRISSAAASGGRASEQD
jgi:hypothetical protein